MQLLKNDRIVIAKNYAHNTTLTLYMSKAIIAYLVFLCKHMTPECAIGSATKTVSKLSFRA